MTDVLEMRLQALAESLDVEVGERLVVGVLQRVRTVPERPHRRRARRGAAAIAAAAALIAAVPGTRHAVADFFGIGSTRIQDTPITITVVATVPASAGEPASAPSSPATFTAASPGTLESSGTAESPGSAESPVTAQSSGTAESSGVTAAPPATETVAATFPAAPSFGPAFTVDAAAARVGVLVPGSVLLGESVGVHVLMPPADGQIVVVYPPSALLPESPVPGVGALLSAWPATLIEGMFVKGLGPGTSLETVTIRPALAGDSPTEAFFLSGEPHTYAFETPAGGFQIDTLRLATNTLLWEVDGVAYRLEADISLADAIRIAESIELHQ